MRSRKEGIYSAASEAVRLTTESLEKRKRQAHTIKVDLKLSTLGNWEPGEEVPVCTLYKKTHTVRWVSTKDCEQYIKKLDESVRKRQETLDEALRTLQTDFEIAKRVIKHVDWHPNEPIKQVHHFFAHGEIKKLSCNEVWEKATGRKGKRRKPKDKTPTTITPHHITSHFRPPLTINNIVGTQPRHMPKPEPTDSPPP
jgi:hypothetical protein